MTERPESTRVWILTLDAETYFVSYGRGNGVRHRSWKAAVEAATKLSTQNGAPIWVEDGDGTRLLKEFVPGQL